MNTWHSHHTLCSPSPLHHIHTALVLYYALWFPAHEGTIIESFEMSPNLICLGWHLRSVLWLASESGLEVICKVICKGILGVRPYISSWGSFQSSQLWCSHGQEIIGRSKERMPSEYGAQVKMSIGHYGSARWAYSVMGKCQIMSIWEGWRWA